MAGDNRSAYCGQCGNPVEAADRFCGTCGAPVLAPAPQAEQVIPRPVAAAHGAPVQSSRRPLLLAGILGALAVLLVGGGALALVGLGYGNNLLGGSEQAPPPPSEERGVAPPQPETTQEPDPAQEPTGGAEGTASATPPSNQPSYEEQEDALLEEFARSYDEAARRGDWEATYSMLDESSQQEFTEEEWAEAQQALLDANGLPDPLEGVTVDQNEEVTDVPARVTLYYEDGTQETIVAGIPMVVEDPSDAGGPKRFLTEEEISELEDLSSVSPEPTTSATPEATTSDSYGLQPDGEDQVREAVENYYLAVDYENWEYTYYNLDSRSKALFTEEEWIEKNQWYADNEGLELDSMEIDVMMDGSRGAEVVVYRTFTDGTSITRETYFVWEEGWWRHRLTEEEKAIFMPGVSYEEFVAAQ